VTEWV